MPTWPAVTTTEGSEVQEHLFSAALQSSPSNDGDRANLSDENEKSVSVVRLQVAKAYWAYALCMMPRTSDRTSVAVFAHRSDDTRRVHASGPRGTPEAKLSDESLITPWPLALKFIQGDA